MRYQRDGFSVEAAIKKKRPIPEDHWYHKKPPVLPDATMFWVAFRDLQSCRAPDGPIPWTACMAYADRKRMPADVAMVLWAVIRRLDIVERNWHAEAIRKGGGGE